MCVCICGLTNIRAATVGESGALGGHQRNPSRGCEKEVKSEGLAFVCSGGATWTPTWGDLPPLAIKLQQQQQPPSSLVIKQMSECEANCRLNLPRTMMIILLIESSDQVMALDRVLSVSRATRLPLSRLKHWPLASGGGGLRERSIIARGDARWQAGRQSSAT